MKIIVQPVYVVFALGPPCIFWYILKLLALRGQNAFHIICCALLLGRPVWQPKTCSCQGCSIFQTLLKPHHLHLSFRLSEAISCLMKYCPTQHKISQT